ncbi:MAG: RNA polymerase sigma factor [Phycisphaerales bacterium]
MSEPLTDAALLTRAQTGDFAAFDTLVSRHEARLLGLARSIVRHEQDAEDIVQTSLLSAVEHLNNFRGEAAFGTWIGRIVVNHALNHLRKRKTRGPVESIDTPGSSAEEFDHPRYIADWRANVEQQVLDHEVREQLDAALAELPDSQRLTFVLRDIEGLDTAETAKMLDISAANVKVRLLRARLALREKLTPRFGDPRKVVPPHIHKEHAP